MALRLLTKSLVPRARAARFFSTTVGHGEFPGGQTVPYVNKIHVVDPKDADVIPAYRVLDQQGKLVPGASLPEGIDEDLAVEIYKHMIRLNSMDNVFYDAQRQGRISFYMTAFGEEGTLFGSAAAIKPRDMVFAQYREAGVLMWRGFTLDQFADQLFSNEGDLGKGRQMPVHYGSRELNYQTVSSPLATQLPQAAGAAYGFKLAKEDRIAVCYFGEGAASEGDFHAALNIAATRDCPVLYFARNNGYAISTPVKDQFRGDGIASRGAGYGIPVIRVDGNDVFAVYEATKKAREMILSDGRPVLLETMSYRQGHHSTSDDSTRYRAVSEIKHWKDTNCPMNRLKLYLLDQGWWSEERDVALKDAERSSVLAALTKAEAKGIPALDTMFEDVYAEKPRHLQDQEAEMLEHIAKYPEHYASGH
ncbi:hypothetical protein SPRG_14335 [Saprolegnia parasitica CBS 223.65]|uniref:2-oxoisovalerate dehydrogenase subunit alpha n=1 Tax=Saprolegnia parasitica (strain CBS 223.65) TaxID=695850 RepID=A0A067BQC1_SAPPC|nr:hypothetical protein SPRG_14335 [Saprolegnia parasitica CBS 223.65]KDO20463.1 hypothetical protein SPRG_14335 [Saprolegnia parasitica CBS 223.65]|eukprot:XP_012208853.1 hypothetical protein SPRG_14335 [Saprolegnia parasitica CBS 223.65]